MTREEAIKEFEEENERFQWFLNNAGEDIFPFQRNVLARDIARNKVAISALSENKGDLISREKLKDYLDRNISFGGVEKKFAFFDIIDSIPSVENKGKWISVTERPPEENSHVLVSVKGEPDFVATDDYFSYGFDDWKDDVTAWMPAPEPYKKEGE